MLSPSAIICGVSGGCAPPAAALGFAAAALAVSWVFVAALAGALADFLTVSCGLIAAESAAPALGRVVSWDVAGVIEVSGTAEEDCPAALDMAVVSDLAAPPPPQAASSSSMPARVVPDIVPPKSSIREVQSPGASRNRRGTSDIAPLGLEGGVGPHRSPADKVIRLR